MVAGPSVPIAEVNRVIGWTKPEEPVIGPRLVVALAYRSQILRGRDAKLRRSDPREALRSALTAAGQ